MINKAQPLRARHAMLRPESTTTTAQKTKDQPATEYPFHPENATVANGHAH